MDARNVSGACPIRLAPFSLGPVFAWQEGYSVFSVSKSQEDALKRYIKGQAEHHKTEDFKSELLRTLRAHSVEFDEKFTFDGSTRGRRIPPPLPGRIQMTSDFPTGFAALHPWLQSTSPPGPKCRPLAQG